MQEQLIHFNMGEDCTSFRRPLSVFAGAMLAGSIEGAVKLNQGDSDIAINWSGGLHHAKKSEASGGSLQASLPAPCLQYMALAAMRHRSSLYYGCAAPVCCLKSVQSITVSVLV